MAPKNDGPATSEVQDNTHGMSADEVSFLVDCLMNPTGGGIVSIDCKAVAAARGQKNPGSISNRINKLKKKYNLPIGTGSGASPRKAQDAGEVTIPNTPSTNKVIKGTRGRAIPKKAASKKMKAREVDSDEGDDLAMKSSSDEVATKAEEVKAEEVNSDDEKDKSVSD